MANGKRQMAIQAREAGSGRPASVQTASAEQLTPLQPFLYNTNIVSPEPFSPHCFMIFSSHFIHDTLVTFVTPCCVICGTEAKIPAQRGRSFRRNCSHSARTSSMGSLTNPWTWTGILTSSCWQLSQEMDSSGSLVSQVNLFSVERKPEFHPSASYALPPTPYLPLTQ